MHEEEARNYLEMGRWTEAAQAARRALAAVPNSAGMWWVLAVSEHQLGHAEGAAGAFEQLIKLEPELPEHWSNLATALRDAGRLEDALAAYAEAAKRGADDGGFHFNVAALLLDLKRLQDALVHLQASHSRQPERGETACLLAETLIALLRLEEAAALLLPWRSWQNLGEELLPRLANLLLQVGEVEQGGEVLKLALLINPPDDDSQAQLISLLERNNQVDEAQAKLHSWVLPATAGAAIKAQHDALAARLAQRRGEHVVAIEHFRSARLAGGEAGVVESDILFALAKSQDVLGQFDACMTTLAEAHEVQMQEISRTHPGIRRDRPFHIADFSVDVRDVEKWQTAVSKTEALTPLFVVGFPRSGTTLLEQSLDAHPQLKAMDEQPFLQKAIEDLQSHGLVYPEGLAAASPEQLAAVREQYFARVASRVQLKPGQRLVDKNPLNLLRLPAIRRIFPDASIVLMQRHPCDVLLSCYMQPFRAPEFAMLCRSLESLAEGYSKALDFFYSQQAILNASVLELRYETLTEGLEGATRQLCALMGLPWDARMLDPAAHALKKGYISTPSYHQVVQPLNRKAVGRWQGYQHHFELVLPALAPMLNRWAYR